ncbi:MAG: phenylalanine--tRNA ligase subunit beta [Candidatus Omnitrophica bacterium CG_4_9_14_0_2_um_filter_43_12]|nr:MAG: phenylalanine--tRNA ligase subunit beta [Candidatus Omnitrophica bacterium CG_4_9_14_0_2_um_filter_43_12]
MRFTYSWLKEYIDVKLKPKELAEKLTMAGLEIEAVSQADGEWVFEAEVTTNRPDWLNIIGIAREVAAITDEKMAATKAGQHSSASTGRAAQPKSAANCIIQVLDKQSCPRYTGRIITGVKVAPSPEWLIKRLKSIGVRSVNNIVDITNFVLFETGQPLHAFDFDKLSGGRIIVRRAKGNEQIVTIDGVTRKLDLSMLVIADENAPVAIAGIMGGKGTEVTESTKTILLESAYFDPAITRKVSRCLGLGSDSSYRFERGVDLAGVKTASDRASALIAAIAGGLTGKIIDIGKKSITQANVLVNFQKVNDVLGTNVPTKEISRILKALGLKSGKTSKAGAVFTIPSWRRDLKKEEDLIEEIIRIYGYDKICTDSVFIPMQPDLARIISDTLVSFGLNEAITYSLVDKVLDDIFQPAPLVAAIKIKNPLSSDFAVLRRNIIAGILNAAKWNLNRNINDIKLFEIGPVYHSEKLDRQEENHIVICLSGTRRDNWQDGVNPVDFYYLKGITDSLFKKLGVSNYDIKPGQSGIFQAEQSAEIMIKGEPAGFLGKVEKGLLKKIDIDKDCFVCQINMDILVKHVELKKRFTALPKFPVVYRDISTLAKIETPLGDIVNMIKETAGDIIKEIKLFDVYKGEQIPKGHRSLIFRLTYQSFDKTLTDKEVEIIHSGIISALKEQLGVGTR